MQSFNFVYLSFSFEKNLFENNVAIIAIKEVHPAIGTPKFVQTPVEDRDLPSVIPLTLTTFSESL